MNNTAIKVEHLYKEYKLGVISHGTLYRDMQSWWAKIRGKEDPNSLVSFHHDQQAEKDSFLALDDISFEVKEGDRVGIIGKNGAGKSTLLKILSQITSPTKGNISIRGRVGSLLEVGTGFHSELTGRENIFLNGSILGMTRHEISKKLDEIVDFADIEKHLDTPVKRYSSGMMVRLGFAVAAHLDTDILIADEVLAVGDVEFQKKALGKMQELSTGQGRTVLFVSHNMAAVKNLCNSGILLEKGRIRETSKDIDQLVSDYLSNFEKVTNIVKWVNNGELQDHNFTPVSLELLEEDEQPVISLISAEKMYKVKLVFEVQELNSLLQIYFVLSDMNGNILFHTIKPPHIKINIGTNTIYFNIPANLLNINKYIISLGSTIQNLRWIINQFEYAVTLCINVTEKANSDTAPGYLAAPLIKIYQK